MPSRSPRSIILFATTLAACSQLEDLSSSNKNSTETPLVATGTGTASATSPLPELETIVSDVAMQLDNPGLPDQCTASASNEGELCVTCTPRILPIIHCEQSSLPNFRVETQCSHDLDLVLCDLGNDPAFRFELEKPSPAEIIYDRFPLLLFGLKLLLGSTMENADENKKEALFKVIDSMNENRLAIFTCSDLTTVAESIADTIALYDSSIPTDFINLFRALAKQEMHRFKNFCEFGLITEENLIKALKTLLQILPGDLAKKIDESEFVAILGALKQGSENPDVAP